jgi:hypothetical protein
LAAYIRSVDEQGKAQFKLPFEDGNNNIFAAFMYSSPILVKVSEYFTLVYLSMVLHA